MDWSALTTLLAVKEEAGGAGPPGVFPAATSAVLQVKLLQGTAIWPGQAGTGAGVVIVEVERRGALLSPHFTAALTAEVLPHLQPLADGLQQAGAEAAHHHHHRYRPQAGLPVFAGEGWVGQTGATASLDTHVGGNHLHSLTSAERENESFSGEINIK